MLFTIGVHKNFVAFTGKHQRWSLFLIKLGIPEKWDLRPGTWDPYVGPGTRGPYVGPTAWNPGPIGRTQNPGPLHGIWDLGLSTCDPF